MTYLLILSPIPVLITLMIYAYFDERRIWNDGVCPCNHQWTSFDMDSQGGRMYKCGSGCYTCISYPGVDA